MAAGTDMTRQVKWMMALRVVIVTSLFLPVGLLFLDELSGGATASTFGVDLSFLVALMASTYALTLAYAVGLRYVKNMARFALLQILMDVLLETAIVYYTGTITTPFLVLYLISVVSASVLLDRRSALGVASVAVLAYLSLLNGIYYRLLPFRSLVYADVSSVRASEVLYTIFVVLTGFLGTSVMTNYLAERTRRTTEALREVGLELTELQRFNERVIDSISGGLIVMTPEGRISFMNAPGSAITGWGLHEVRGRPLGALLPEAERVLEDARKALAAKKVYRFEGTMAAQGGREIPVGASVTGLPGIESEGRASTVGLVLIFQDLTELKKLEAEVRLKERLASVGEMASGIAHEIRNPLASMSGSVQLLRSELDLTGDQKRLMDIVVDESRRLSRIIEDFLTYVRPPRPRLEVVDLGILVDDALTLLRNGEELRPDHVLELRRSEGLRAEVDPGQLRQVFWNVALNAIWSMPGGGTLVVTLDGRSPEEVVVTVGDTGVGIPADRLASLFTPFSSPGRSGLGLSIVYRIVREHGGNISVDSEVGKGTRVTIRLPRGGSGERTDGGNAPPIAA